MPNLCKVNNQTQKNRGENTPHNNKLNFSKMKNNTIQSLNEVEYFWNNFNNFCKYIRLYKILK